MKKIPTLFIREFEDHKVVKTSSIFTNLECMAAFYFGTPTIKYDGSCCAVIDGIFYKRYDAKKGKSIPENAIKCQEKPDPITGHMPCWVPVDDRDTADKWFVAAMENVCRPDELLPDGTYEAIGKHFQGNPYLWNIDTLVPHGTMIAEVFRPPIPGSAQLTDDDCELALNYTKSYLEKFAHEGIVFWLNDRPVCKIKRTDFGLKWPRLFGEVN